MNERLEKIYETTREMLSEGADLTTRKVPELPVLKERSGYGDITSKERDAVAKEVGKELAAVAKNAANGGSFEDDDAPERATYGLSEHFPTTLYHKNKPPLIVKNDWEYEAAGKGGYKPMEDFKPEERRAIYKALPTR